MSNPCDIGICNPSECHDEECLHQDYVLTNPDQKKVTIFNNPTKGETNDKVSEE